MQALRAVRNAGTGMSSANMGREREEFLNSPSQMLSRRLSVLAAETLPTHQEIVRASLMW
jgi:hypothetical protein